MNQANAQTPVIDTIVMPRSVESTIPKESLRSSAMSPTLATRSTEQSDHKPSTLGSTSIVPSLCVIDDLINELDAIN
jgi:hypothetical protein